MQKRRRALSDQQESVPHWLASHQEAESHGEHASVQSLSVEAHEADLIYGKDHLAHALEAPESNDENTDSNLSASARGSSLIKWEGGNGAVSAMVDRFDARLLLSELPPYCSAKNELPFEPGSPDSSSGWSDLPSDTEDAFFLSASEVADIRRTKRRRMLEDARDQRLSALHAAGHDDSEPEDTDTWGGSDEEPDAAQTVLMERTAVHLHASPDRALLAARILTNHGADKRFAFMRGRWRKAWLRAQAKVAVASAEEEDKKRRTNGLAMGLGAYGDSDEDEDEEDETTGTAVATEERDETAKIEARRARARKWTAKRRAEKGSAPQRPKSLASEEYEQDQS